MRRLHATALALSAAMGIATAVLLVAWSLNAPLEEVVARSDGPSTPGGSDPQPPPRPAPLSDSSVEEVVDTDVPLDPWTEERRAKILRTVDHFEDLLSFQPRERTLPFVPPDGWDPERAAFEAQERLAELNEACGACPTPIESVDCTEWPCLLMVHVRHFPDGDANYRSSMACLRRCASRFGEVPNLGHSYPPPSASGPFANGLMAMHMPLEPWEIEHIQSQRDSVQWSLSMNAVRRQLKLWWYLHDGTTTPSP